MFIAPPYLVNANRNRINPSQIKVILNSMADRLRVKYVETGQEVIKKANSKVNILKAG